MSTQCKEILGSTLMESKTYIKLESEIGEEKQDFPEKWFKKELSYKNPVTPKNSYKKIDRIAVIVDKKVHNFNLHNGQNDKVHDTMKVKMKRDHKRNHKVMLPKKKYEKHEENISERSKCASSNVSPVPGTEKLLSFLTRTCVSKVDTGKDYVNSEAITLMQSCVLNAQPRQDIINNIKKCMQSKTSLDLENNYIKTNTCIPCGFDKTKKVVCAEKANMDRIRKYAIAADNKCLNEELKIAIFEKSQKERKNIIKYSQIKREVKLKEEAYKQERLAADVPSDEKTHEQEKCALQHEVKIESFKIEKSTVNVESGVEKDQQENHAMNVSSGECYVKSEMDPLKVEIYTVNVESQIEINHQEKRAVDVPSKVESHGHMSCEGEGISLKKQNKKIFEYSNTQEDDLETTHKKVFVMDRKPMPVQSADGNKLLQHEDTAVAKDHLNFIVQSPKAALWSKQYRANKVWSEGRGSIFGGHSERELERHRCDGLCDPFSFKFTCWHILNQTTKNQLLSSTTACGNCKTNRMAEFMKRSAAPSEYKYRQCSSGQGGQNSGQQNKKNSQSQGGYNKSKANTSDKSTGHSDKQVRDKDEDDDEFGDKRKNTEKFSRNSVDQGYFTLGHENGGQSEEVSDIVKGGMVKSKKVNGSEATTIDDPGGGGDATRSQSSLDRQKQPTAQGLDITRQSFYTSSDNNVDLNYSSTSEYHQQDQVFKDANMQNEGLLVECVESKVHPVEPKCQSEQYQTSGKQLKSSTTVETTGNSKQVTFYKQPTIVKRDLGKGGAARSMLSDGSGDGHNRKLDIKNTLEGSNNCDNDAIVNTPSPNDSGYQKSNFSHSTSFSSTLGSPDSGHPGHSFTPEHSVKDINKHEEIGQNVEIKSRACNSLKEDNRHILSQHGVKKSALRQRRLDVHPLKGYSGDESQSSVGGLQEHEIVKLLASETQNDTYRSVMKSLCVNLIRFCSFRNVYWSANQSSSILVDLISHYVKCRSHQSNCIRCLSVVKIWENHHSYNEHSPNVGTSILQNGHTRCPIELCQKRGKKRISRMQAQERKGYSLNYISLSLTASNFSVESNPEKLKLFFTRLLLEHNCLTNQEHVELQKGILQQESKVRNAGQQDTVSSRRATFSGSRTTRSHSPNYVNSIDSNVPHEKSKRAVSFHPSTFNDEKPANLQTYDHREKSTPGVPLVNRYMLDVARHSIGSAADDSESPSTELSVDAEDIPDGHDLNTPIQENVDNNLGLVLYGGAFDLQFRAGIWMDYLEDFESVSGYAIPFGGRAEGIILQKYCNLLTINTDTGSYEDEAEWTLLPFLGSGVSGKCYLATDRTTKMKFCVKIIDLQNFDSEEIQVWTKFDDDNIVKLYGALRKDTEIYLLSEYIDGGTLKDYISRQEDGINLWLAIKFIQDILRALVHMANQYVIHEDLKADNIMIQWQPSPRCVVIDFGLSVELDSERPYRENEQPLGGQTHLSPEKAQSIKYDYKSDVWAAMCDFLHMLSGSEPWIRRFGELQTLLYIIANNSPPLDDIPDRSDITQEVRDFIKVGMTVIPAKRPSAAQLLMHPIFTMLDNKIMMPSLPYTTDQNRNRSIPIDQTRDADNNVQPINLPSVIESFRDQVLLVTTSEETVNVLQNTNQQFNLRNELLTEKINLVSQNGNGGLKEDIIPQHVEHMEVNDSCLNQDDIIPRGPPSSMYQPGDFILTEDTATEHIPSIVRQLSNDEEVTPNNSAISFEYAPDFMDEDTSQFYDTSNFEDLSESLSQFESKVTEFNSKGELDDNMDVENEDNNYADDDFHIPDLSVFGGSTVYDDATSDVMSVSNNVRPQNDIASEEQNLYKNYQQLNVNQGENSQIHQDGTQNRELEYVVNNKCRNTLNADTELVYSRRNQNIVKPKSNKNEQNNRNLEKLHIPEDTGLSASASSGTPVTGLRYGMRDGVFWTRNPEARRRMPHSHTAPIELSSSQDNSFNMHRSFSNSPYSYEHPPTHIPQTPSRSRLAPLTLDWGHEYDIQELDSATNLNRSFERLEDFHSQNNNREGPFPLTSTPVRKNENLSINSHHSSNNSKKRYPSVESDTVSQRQQKELEQWSRAVEEKNNYNLLHSLSMESNPQEKMEKLHESLTGSYKTAVEHHSWREQQLSLKEMKDIMHDLPSSTSGARGVKVEFCTPEHKVLIAIRITDPADMWRDVVIRVANNIHDSGISCFTVMGDGSSEPLDLTSSIPPIALIQVIVEEVKPNHPYQWKISNSKVDYSKDFRGHFMS